MAVKELAQQAGKNIVGGASTGIGATIGDYLQRGLDKIFGINRKKEQLEQQDALSAIQKEHNKDLASYGNQLQKELWDYTNYENQVQHLKNAGLNPALMYGMSGGGGATAGSSGAGSVSGGTASDEASQKMADTQRLAMGLQMQKTQSEIAVNQSIADKNKAEAKLSESKSTTEEEQRNILIGKLRQEGVYYWIQNEINELKLQGDSNTTDVIKDKLLGYVLTKNENSWAKQEIALALLKTVAETENLDANKILANERAKAIWTELLIAQQKADADTMRAKAQELAVNWGTGKFTNWKTWVDLGANALKMITSLVR